MPVASVGLLVLVRCSAVIRHIYGKRRRDWPLHPCSILASERSLEWSQLNNSIEALLLFAFRQFPIPYHHDMRVTRMPKADAEVHDLRLFVSDVAPYGRRVLKSSKCLPQHVLGDANYGLHQPSMRRGNAPIETVVHYHASAQVGVLEGCVMDIAQRPILQPTGPIERYVVPRVIGRGASEPPAE